MHLNQVWVDLGGEERQLFIHGFDVFVFDQIRLKIKSNLNRIHELEEENRELKRPKGPWDELLIKKKEV
jgi:hypothetical protein